jgi:hypothetical protein
MPHTMKRLLIVLCAVALLASCEQQQKESAGAPNP